MKPVDVKISEIVIEDRVRSDLGNIPDLAESIKLKGLIQPITINQGKKLLAGGRRLAAHKLLELETIPAIIRQTEDDLDDAEIELFENHFRKDMTWQESLQSIKRIHELMQEKHGEEWNQRELASLLNKSLGSVNEAVNLANAMEVVPELAESANVSQMKRKMKRIIEQTAVNEVLEEMGADKPKKVAQFAASHYQLGDALAGMEKAVKKKSVYHFAEVDPPYAIDLKAKRREEGEHLETYNEISKSKYPAFLNTTTQLVYDLLHDNAFCVWWFAEDWQPEVRKALENAGFSLDPIPCVWEKQGKGVSLNPEAYLARTYESFYVARKGNPLLRKRGRPNIFSFAGVSTTDRIHSTERPVALIKELLVTFAYPGARVLCPFLGSGNTLLAAYQEGMTGWGFDLSDEHRKGFLARVNVLYPDDLTEG